jgi:chromosome segregation ATPase
MSALTDSVTAIEAELVTYDAAVAQLAAAQTALAQAQANIETVRDDQTLTVTNRASQLVTLKSTAEVLESDISQQKQAVAALRTQLIADSTALQSNLRAELGGKINTLMQTTVASIQTDYDTSRIMFPVTQIAAAHRDIVALRSFENSLLMHRPGDVEYITFARGAGALLTQIG